jgi:hypothetical protein
MGVPRIVLTWLTVPIAGAVVWDVDYRAIATAATESGDPTTWQESVTSGPITVPGTTLRIVETMLNLTAGNFAVDDFVQMEISRDGTDVADTVAGDVILLDAEFEWQDV